MVFWFGFCLFFDFFFVCHFLKKFGGVVSLGILVISLAASSSCSETDSATTYTSGNYTIYCTGGKMQPPKPVNNSSHLFPEMWD